MIFVTVGSTPFPRLIEKMDKIAGEVDEPVIMQIGLTKYSCKYARCIQFLDFEDLLSFMQQARVIICHDGMGTTITALQCKKPIISVPRLKEFGEMFFDNKGDAINLLAEQGNIKLISNIDELKSALENVDLEVTYMESDNYRSLINALSEYLNKLHI